MTEKLNPIVLFHEWFADAKKSEPLLPEAMSLATAGNDGKVSSRMVLMKSATESGFVFFTNTDSQKAICINQNSNVALLFHWKSLSRQIRINGRAELIDKADSDAYFATRPRESKIGAWSSMQSKPMLNKEVLAKNIEAYKAQFGSGQIPRPPFWEGYRVFPEQMEFWEEGEFRLHNRRQYNKTPTGWSIQLLYP
mgnify:CR=1 FL=1